MFGWIPRWHPVTWILVIILVIWIFSDPSGAGNSVKGLLADGVRWAHQFIIFVKNT